MEQQINVVEELERLENQIGRAIVGATQNEVQDVKKEIRMLVQRVEEILVYQAGLPRGNVARIIENLQENLNHRFGRNLTSSREEEYNETKANLATIEQSELQDTSEKLAYFQLQGISSKSNKYCSTVEEICEEVITDYRKKLGNIGTRGSEEAYMDIRNSIRRTSDNLQGIHEDYTRRIKQDITNKVGELGFRITDALNHQIEQTAVEKSQDDLSDFTKTIQSQTKSTDEVTRDDAKQIRENDAAFKGSQEPRDTQREDLASLFK